MAVKGKLIVTRVSQAHFEVSGIGLTSGLFLGTVAAKGKVFESEGKSYPTLNHAVLALARGQNRRFRPRASFHQSRIIYEEQL